MNNLQQHFRKNNLMQQGQNMFSQQQNDFDNWYNIGSSVGNAFFPNMAGGSKDGQYGDTDLTKLDGYDKSLSDKQNYNNLVPQELSGVGQTYFDTSVTNPPVANESLVGGVSQQPSYDLSNTQMVFGGNNSIMNQGANNIGYNGNFLKKLRGINNGY